MAIKHDRSWNSILVQCTECPFWFSLQLDQREAYLAGERHLVRAHEVEAVRAAAPRLLWEKRHAEDA